MSEQEPIYQYVKVGMSEPTYEYVKGHGWVPQTYESFTDFNKYGKRVTLVKRKPKLGESGWWVSVHDTLKGVFRRDFYTANQRGWVNNVENLEEGPSDYLVTVFYE